MAPLSQPYDRYRGAKSRRGAEQPGGSIVCCSQEADVPSAIAKNRSFLLLFFLLGLAARGEADVDTLNPFVEDSYLAYPIETDRQIFELQIAPLYTLGPFRRSLGLGLTFSPGIRIKMFDAKSSPVKTPSYMPRVTLSRSFSAGRSDFTFFTALAHHSNGQSGQTFVAERLSIEGPEATASFDVSTRALREQLEKYTGPSGTVYFGLNPEQQDTLVTYLTGRTLLNIRDGNFSTNNVELGGGVSWRDLWGLKFLALGASHEIHPRDGVWFFRISRKIADAYGRRRTNLRMRAASNWFRVESAIKVIGNWKTDRLAQDLDCELDGSVKLCQYESVTNLDTPQRFFERSSEVDFSLKFSLFRISSVDFGKFSFFGRFWYGQNYYNIHFAEEKLKQIMFGISHAN